MMCILIIIGITNCYMISDLMKLWTRRHQSWRFNPVKTQAWYPWNVLVEFVLLNL